MATGPYLYFLCDRSPIETKTSVCLYGTYRDLGIGRTAGTYCKVSGEKPDRNEFWSGPDNVSVPSAGSVHLPSLRSSQSRSTHTCLRLFEEEVEACEMACTRVRRGNCCSLQLLVRWLREGGRHTPPALAFGGGSHLGHLRSCCLHLGPGRQLGDPWVGGWRAHSHD